MLSSAKALGAKNACKACGLGMGGQLGGMTNELGEFPSVCNKSLQAQSTDIQVPIPEAVFQHSLQDFQELSARELEHLGRLGQPMRKAAGDTRYRPVSWDEAIRRTAGAFAATQPERSFFYSSGRSSNEAGFLLQLMARLYGTNNVTNCSYYCHQATGVALRGTIGTGTSTVELEDISGCDLFVLVGANPASNHPRLLHKLIELRRRGGTVIVINPLKEPGLVKFAAPKMASSMLKGGDEVASLYLQPRAGSDVALFSALAKRLLELDATDKGFITRHTAGFEPLRDHLASLDTDALLDACGIQGEALERVVRAYAGASSAIFAWGMGMTHHQHGVENIEWLCNLALLRGMLGKRHAGLLPLRGHSNVQGIGTIGVKPVLPAEVFTRIEESFGVTLPRTPGLHTLAGLEAGFDHKIDAAMMMGGNLYAATPDSRWAEAALDNIGFKVFLTTTLNHGHIRGVQSGESLLLPVCARDEEPEPTTQESMFNYVRLSDGGIERIAEARSEVRVLADIATQLLPACPVDFSAFRRHGKVREAIVAVIPGMEALADIDVARREFTVQGRILHSPAFKTPDGRAHFVTPSQPAPDDTSSHHAFTLITLRSEGQFNSIIYEEDDSYRGVADRWSVLMNRTDALELGVCDGGRADLISDSGEMRGLAVRIFDLPRGCVAAYYPEANAVTGRVCDPRSHTPQFKSVPVSVRPGR
ncbi:MAG: FdhF/YdeP family oxidoreductase [Halioglobus sp.]|nr:FdhF/YdeP family oxidoreductase [Halioglobus sp.]